MCHLLLDTSPKLQQTAFTIVRQAARRYIEHVVVEAAVDSSDESTIGLPIELLELLRNAFQKDEMQDSEV